MVLDPAKNVFQVHGVDEHGVITFKKQIKRVQLSAFFADVPDAQLGCRPRRGPSCSPRRGRHDAVDANAQPSLVRHRLAQELRAAGSGFIGLDGRKRHLGVVVDRQMHGIPVDALVAIERAVTGDAMPMPLMRPRLGPRFAKRVTRKTLGAALAARSALEGRHAAEIGRAHV